MMKISSATFLLAVGCLQATTADAQRLRKLEATAVGSKSAKASSSTPRVFDFSGPAVGAGDFLIPQAACRGACYRKLPNELRLRKLQTSGHPEAGCPDDDTELPFCNGREDVGDFCGDAGRDPDFNICRFDGNDVDTDNCSSSVDGSRLVLQRFDCNAETDDEIVVPISICSGDCFEVIPFSECPESNTRVCLDSTEIDELCVAKPLTQRSSDQCSFGFELNNCQFDDIVRKVDCPSSEIKSGKSSKSGGTGSKSSRSGRTGSKSSSPSWDGPPQNEAHVSVEAHVDDPVDSLQEFKDLLTDIINKLGGRI